MNRMEFTIQEENGKEIKLAIRRPQYDDIDEADKVYASKVARSVREKGNKKLLLRSEIDSFLRETGVWTEVDEKAVSSVQKEIDECLGKLKKGGIKLSEGRQLCLDINDKRKEVMRIMSKRQIFDDTTIESMAEAERTDYLVYTCTVYADSGQNYWESFDDMKNDKLSQVYRTASIKAMQLVYNVNPDFEKKLPENRWMLKYNFVDEDLNYINRKTKEKVDRSGNPVQPLEDAVQEQLASLQGEIKEDTPFIDDETGEIVPTS